MHELAIAQSLVNTISSWRDLNGGKKVLNALIELGPLCGVDVDSLQFAWKSACEFAGNGALRGCSLKVELLKFRYACKRCGGRFESENMENACSLCGAEMLVREGGHELNLKSIEVE